MHALRHYYASFTLADGVNIKELNEYLGHHDPGSRLRFGAADNDWGSIISLALGGLHPGEVLGVHVSQIFAEPETDTETEAACLTEQERADRAW
jgi:hypothetical protein